MAKRHRGPSRYAGSQSQRGGSHRRDRGTAESHDGLRHGQDASRVPRPAVNAASAARYPAGSQQTAHGSRGPVRESKAGYGSRGPAHGSRGPAGSPESKAGGTGVEGRLMNVEGKLDLVSAGIEAIHGKLDVLIDQSEPTTIGRERAGGRRPARATVFPVSAGDSATGVDACAGGWVAVTLRPSAVGDPSCPLAATVVAAPTLDGLSLHGVVGIDIPLGLLEDGWRVADVLARRALGRLGSTVFAIPPRPVWQYPTYAEANKACRELTGKGLSAQTWGLRGKLLEADAYRRQSADRPHEAQPAAAGATAALRPPGSTRSTPSLRSPPSRARRWPPASTPRRDWSCAGTCSPRSASPCRRWSPARRRTTCRRRRRRLVRPSHRRRRGRHPHQPRPARRRRHRDRHPRRTTSCPGVHPPATSAATSDHPPRHPRNHRPASASSYHRSRPVGTTQPTTGLCGDPTSAHSCHNPPP